MSTHSPFVAGVRAALPFILVVAPFGMLFGVLATEAGLTLTQTMTMTALVIAGSAQFTALQLMQDQAPVLIVLATSLAVNMRMAMYSASMAPHIGAAPLWQRAVAAYVLVDQTYGVAIARFEDRCHPLSVAQKMAFFCGAAVCTAPWWYLATWVGAVAGEAIPPEYALDFAIPITFLALFAPMLRTLAHVAAALVSTAGALALVWVPFNLGLIVAATLAMVAGALVEIWSEGRTARAPT